MALQAVHRRAVHRLAIHCRCRCTYNNVALPSKCPSQSRRRQAVHCQAIAPSIAKPSVAELFIAVAIEPSIAVTSLRRRCVASSRPSLSRCRQANHSRALAPSIAKPSITKPFITVAVAVALPSTSLSPSRCPSPPHCCKAVHRQAIVPSIAEPSIAKPFIAIPVELSIAIRSFHRHRVAVTPFIAKPLRSPLPSRPLPSQPSPSHPLLLPLRQPLPSHSLQSLSRFHRRRIAVTTSIPVVLTSSCSSPSPRAVHRQAVHRRAIHRQANHRCCRHSFIAVTVVCSLPSRCHLDNHRSCIAITLSIAVTLPKSRPSPSCHSIAAALLSSRPSPSR